MSWLFARCGLVVSDFQHVDHLALGIDAIYNPPTEIGKVMQRVHGLTCRNAGKKKKVKPRTSDISAPTDFKHIAHVSANSLSVGLVTVHYCCV